MDAIFGEPWAEDTTLSGRVARLERMVCSRSEKAVDRKVERERMMDGFFRQCATSFINDLDANIKQGIMCVSNMECEDIESAFRNADWAKLHRYHLKYID